MARPMGRSELWYGNEFSLPIPTREAKIKQTNQYITTKSCATTRCPVCCCFLPPAWEAWEPDPEGALAMSKQLTDGFGRAVKPDGMAVGTCLSCKVSVYTSTITLWQWVETTTSTRNQSNARDMRLVVYSVYST